jgi:hypothetical protein
LLNNVFGKCRAVNFFWERENRQDILVDQNQGGPEIPPLARGFRLALKVQSSNVRTDTDRRQG